MFVVASILPNYKASFLFQLLQRIQRRMQHWQVAGNSDLASRSKFAPISKTEIIINQPRIKVISTSLFFVHTSYIGRTLR